MSFCQFLHNFQRKIQYITSKIKILWFLNGIANGLSYISITPILSKDILIIEIVDDH